MKEIIFRPLALFCFSFYILMCVLPYTDAGVRLILTAVLAVALAAVTAMRFRKRKNSALRAVSAVCLGMILAASLSCVFLDIYIASLEKHSGETVCFEGVVEQTEYSSTYSAAYTVKANIDGFVSPVRMIFISEPGLETGDLIFAEGELSTAETERLFGTREAALSRRIVFVCDPGDSRAQVIGRNSHDVRIVFSRINEKLKSLLCDSRAGENIGIAAAAALGNRESLKMSTENDFRHLGVSHVLALSGMHLSVICALAGALSRRLGARWQRIICAATVILYAMLTGLSMSVCRAGIMVLVAYAAAFSGRGSDSYTNLGIAAFLICLFDPYASMDIGLQLSVAAVFAILTVMSESRDERMNRQSAKPPRGIWIWIWTSVCVTTGVVVFTLPLTWLYFGSFSVLSPLTSLIFSFLITVILWLSPIALIFAKTAHISVFIFKLLGAVCDITSFLATKTASIPDTVASINIFTFIIYAVFLILLVLLLLKGRSNRITKTVLCTAAFVVMCLCTTVFSAIGGEETAVFAVNSGVSDAIVITCGSNVCVADVGNGYMSAMYKGLKLAEGMSADRVELVLLTHYHTSHPASLEKLFDKYTVQRLAVPSELELFELSELEKVCNRHGVGLELYEKGNEVSIGSATVVTYKDEYMSRSIQPVVRLDVKWKDDAEDALVYLGGAYTEAVQNVQISEGTTVCFGSHGAKYKEEIVIPEGTEAVYALGSAVNYLP